MSEERRSHPHSVTSGNRERSAARRAVLTYQDACRALVQRLNNELPAERGLVIAYEGHGSQGKAEILLGLERDGTPIEHADFYLADYNLKSDTLDQIWSSGRAQLQQGVEEGRSRALIFYPLRCTDEAGSIFAFEAQAPTRRFEPDSVQRLEQAFDPLLPQLQAQCRTMFLEAANGALGRQVEELSQRLQAQDYEGTKGDEAEGGEPGEVETYHGLITRSAKMRELFHMIERIKDTDLSTLVIGETGTGKELVARAIHFGSRRASRTFEVVACGTLSQNLLESELFGYRKGAFSGANEDRKGFFERADGGTVFLDEVADMTPEMQQKILRALQEKEIRPIGADEPVPVNVRVISSTRKDLAALVERSRFREDLFYRLNGLTLNVPPLRERREDIPLLLNTFLAETCEEEGVVKSFSDSAGGELFQHSWPGNVQELRNVVTRAFLASPRNSKIISRKVVGPLLSREVGNLFLGEDLCQIGDRLRLRIPVCEGFNEMIAECEKLILITALRKNRGNKSRVTQQLGIPRQTLYNKIEKYKIDVEDYLHEE